MHQVGVLVGADRRGPEKALVGSQSTLTRPPVLAYNKMSLWSECIERAAKDCRP